RAPERHQRAGFESVISPADGRVLVAGDAVPDAAPPGAWKQISIFLSPVDVHVNRIPASGRVTKVMFTPGKFLAAYKHDAASTNERSEIWIDHGGEVGGGGPDGGFPGRARGGRAPAGLLGGRRGRLG